jgi:glycerol-3-phosphate O-acyltransferase
MGGLNVAFWPIGPWAKRSGMVFIRRSIRDDEVYKFALREYMGYLVRKRFNLEWYIEGGRTRTGKLRPPRLGLLAYLVDAFRGGAVDDVYLVPASIVYDQLFEVGEMAKEEHGASKRRESLGFLLEYARAQGRIRGKVNVRFGEPLSLREALDAAADDEHAVEKIAFEVSHRINRATPVTPISLLALALLGGEDRAVTLDEIRAVLNPLLDYVKKRDLPARRELLLDDPEGVKRTLDALVRSGVVTCFAGGLEPVWAVSPNRHLEAAFYRNGAAHHFVNRAIAELVVARAAECGDRINAWREARRLRDMLKFEFFFGSKKEFAQELAAELRLVDPDWEQRSLEPAEVWTRLEAARPHLAHRVLQSFLEAYQVVAERLAARDPAAAVDEKEFLRECIGVGRQWRMQGRLHSTESISRELFSNGLKLAANRGLLEPGAPGRRAFADEIGDVVRRLQRIREMAIAELGQ